MGVSIVMGGTPNWMFFKGKSQSMNGWYLGVPLWLRKPLYINWCTISSTVSSQNIPTKLKNHGWESARKGRGHCEGALVLILKKEIYEHSQEKGVSIQLWVALFAYFFFLVFSQLLEVHNIKLKYIGWSKLRSPGLQNAYSPKEDVSGP